MFRSSLRSVSDPLRDHVCFSCIATSCAQARTFRTTSLSRTESQDGTPFVADKSFDEAFRTLTQTLDSYKRPKAKNSQPRRTKTQTQEPTDTEQRETPSNEEAQPSGVQLRLKNLVGKLEKKNSSKEPIVRKLRSREFPQPPTLLSSSITSRVHDKLTSSKPTVKEVDVETQPVPGLSYGLERVLFNPGVYHLRDPRSRVFNFDPYLGTVMPVTEFDFTALKDYITSSKDDNLRNIAIANKKKYIGSSSSMTGVLSHFHYLLSAWRPINTESISQGFTDDMKSFTRIMRAPAAMILRYQDGVYAIDADKEFDSANILMNLGKSMEKLLTLPKDEFERYRRTHQNKITAEEEALCPESYHYSTMGDFLMRSQLDAHDPRLPGTGMFDLKTRAVVSIRMDARDFEKGLGYQIKSRFGMFESYEREYFDMIRSAFLKYSLQVRIGRMDGIFVAFHNIERIFGFQYISLPEMDQALHGQSDTALGDAEFRLSLQLWNKILDKATAKYPKRSLRFHFECRDTVIPYMYIFFEPVTDDEIHAIQNKNKAEIDDYQQRILNLEAKGDDQDASSTQQDDQSPEDATTTADVPPESEAATNADASPDTEQRELSGIFLTLVNRHNGSRVERPNDFSAKHSWSVEYEMSDLEGPKIHHLYQACITRRKKLLSDGREDVSGEPVSFYIQKLRKLAREGRKARKKEDKIDKQQGVTVLDGVQL
ncbi:mitochondrial protein Pet127-domain-containing protein [Aspergillus varians]